MSGRVNWPAGVQRVVLESTDSTNAEALRRAPGVQAPLWICALRQSAARGRQGRSWSCPEGNFAATLAMRLDEPPSRLALRSFVASLALHDVLEDLTRTETPLALKWPNDVLLDGGKVAGILLETTGTPPVLAIGFGVNLVHIPQDIDNRQGAFAPVALKCWSDREVSPVGFLDHLACAYARREAVFTRFGFAPIRQAWLAKAARLGQEITARTSRRNITGIFRTVDDDGQLVLSTPDATVAIPAADVYF
ncbi:MAG: biotin--[acetyl-CoA-carboxylase] ligase [Pseudomonadota bacterium]